MRMWQIVSAGIIALIVAGCATPHAAPRALAGLSCGAGQRIVIAAYPLDSPDVAGMQRKLWWSGLSDLNPLVFPLPSLIGKAVTLALPPVEDLAPEFRKSINVTLQGVDLRQLLFSRAEQSLKPQPPCKTAYVASSWDKPGEYQPSDKVVGIGLYLIFLKNRPTITGYLSATVMTGENAVARERAMLPYFAICEPKAADLDKLQQCAALAQNLGAGLPPPIDSMTFYQESPHHSTEEWEADGGKLVIQEITVLMDRLLADLGQALFNSP